MNHEYLTEKRLEVMKEIKPICEAFNIKDYDYQVNLENGSEFLRIGEQRIGCSCNSVSAVIDELIGYIFICRWKRNRTLGAFSKQTENVIKRYWIKEETSHAKENNI